SRLTFTKSFSSATIFGGGGSALIARCLSLLGELRGEAGIDLARIRLEDLLLVGGGDRGLVDVAFGVVEMMPGLGIDTAHRADHLRGKEDVVDRDHLGEEINARLVIDAGVEEHVLQDQLAERRALLVLRQAAIAAPMIGYGAAAMRDDELQGRKILEDVGHDEL